MSSSGENDLAGAVDVRRRPELSQRRGPDSMAGEEQREVVRSQRLSGVIAECERGIGAYAWLVPVGKRSGTDGGGCQDDYSPLHRLAQSTDGWLDETEAWSLPPRTCFGGRRLLDSHVEAIAYMGLSQQDLYAEIDLELSWSERDLPERERTKHVHRLHPYLGKFIPQLVEALLARHLPAGGRVLDPFAGSGTTLVQALESGLDAAGADVAAFNCLLMRVKTRSYNPFVLEREVRDALSRLEAREGEAGEASAYVREWFAPEAADDLLRFRSLVDGCEHADVLRIVLARAARSARLTPHFDLDFPRLPQRGEYWCHKHRRVCRPVERASHFLRRYGLDTVRRIKEFSRVRARGREATVLHGDSRELAFGGPFDGIVTSPPYPGLIDYHRQHRYAYDLLGLDELAELELGSAAGGTSVRALEAYAEGIAATLRNAATSLRAGAPVVIVINDRRDLYPKILERAGMRIDERYKRHVNRRTGRRAGEFFEDVLIARAV